jgi:hypothetical protein
MCGKDNPREDESLNWLACAVDGEGHITIERQVVVPRYRSPRYTLRVGVANNSLLFLQHCAKLWPGFNIHRSGYENDRRKQSYVWLGASQAAFAFIKAVRPFLVIKGAQADLGIEFQESMKRRGWVVPPEEIARRHRLYEAILKLNAKGPLPATTKREDTEG